MKRVAAYLGIATFLVSFPVSASADTQIMVLGIRSIEGDDEFAQSLTGALRHAAGQVPGWDVSDREVSLAQMSLAHGCDEPDARCMQQIAQTLSTQRVIYGTVRRTSAADDFDYAVTLYMFNAESSQIEGSLTDTIPRVRSEIDFLRRRVEGYVAQLSGTQQPGTLRITGTVPGADVFVDGERAGTADAQGTFTAEVPAGRRRVEVNAEGYNGFRGSVTVPQGSEAEIEVALQAGSGGSSGGGTAVDAEGGVNWAGWGLVGLGVVAGAATIYSWAQINSLDQPISADECPTILENQPSSLAAYRCYVPERFADACDEALAGLNHGAPGHTVNAAKETCREANTLEILQWAFLGVAVAATGAGVLLLATGTEDGEEEPSNFSVTPTVDQYGGRVDARLRF